MTSAQTENLCNRAMRAIEEIRRMLSIRTILNPEHHEEIDEIVNGHIEELKQVTEFFRRGGQPVL